MDNYENGVNDTANVVSGAINMALEKIEKLEAENEKLKTDLKELRGIQLSLWRSIQETISLSHKLDSKFHNIIRAELEKQTHENA